MSAAGVHKVAHGGLVADLRRNAQRAAPVGHARVEASAVCPLFR
jgi:hypothetical protein